MIIFPAASLLNPVRSCLRALQQLNSFWENWDTVMDPNKTLGKLQQRPSPPTETPVCGNEPANGVGGLSSFFPHVSPSMVLLCFFVLSLISGGGKKKKKGRLSCRLGDGRLTKESISLLHHHLSCRIQSATPRLPLLALVQRLHRNVPALKSFKRRLFSYVRLFFWLWSASNTSRVFPPRQSLR